MDVHEALFLINKELKTTQMSIIRKLINSILIFHTWNSMQLFKKIKAVLNGKTLIEYYL